VGRSRNKSNNNPLRISKADVRRHANRSERREVRQFLADAEDSLDEIDSDALRDVGGGNAKFDCFKDWQN
jgi:hypothetical protein